MGKQKKGERSSFSKTLVYIANRMWLILSIYVVSLLISATLFSFFEDKSFLDGLWWSAITALTVGYGDLSPATLSGRITGIFFGHFWIFGVIPMIICNIVSKIIEDKDKFTDAEQEWQESTLKKIAIAVKAEIDEAPPSY